MQTNLYTTDSCNPSCYNKTSVLITVANGKGTRPVKPVHYSHDQLILSCTASIAWFLFCPGVLIYCLCFIVLSQTDMGGVGGGESLPRLKHADNGRLLLPSIPRRGELLSFVGVCVVVAIFGVANALVQGGMLGDLSFMLPVFLQSILAGLAAAGTLTSALRLVTKAAFERSENGVRKGATLFLAVSTIFQLFCILLYTYFFPKLPIVKYFHAKAALEGSKTVLGDLAAAGIETRKDPHEDSVKQVERLSNKQLFYQNIDYALDLFLLYALTLSIFPGFLYKNTGKHRLGTWYPLVLVAVFNIWDLVSRYFPLVKLLKIRVQEMPHDCNTLLFLTCPCFLLHCQVRRPGMDDIARIRSRINKCSPYSLCIDCST
ncbi:hypothetical protein V6N11_074355 [Hibiscus sabdariffa]|uniref:Uncharacterized protein n=1 Tax=Hibiscus sabdariffa TaxID=183260 RepID=A0ABR2R3V3_9ROSI